MLFSSLDQEQPRVHGSERIRRWFVGVPDSPWTERARWALEHHTLPYLFVERLPWNMPWIRLLTRRPVGRVIVPVLRDRSQVVAGAFQIVMHAEREGRQARLLPDITEMARWDRRSDQICAAGRLLGASRVLAHRQALAAAAPPWLPTFLRPAFSGVASARIRHRMGRYELSRASRDVATVALTAGLLDLRRALAGRPYLLGESFSYADIAMATALGVLQPIADPSSPGANALQATKQCIMEARDFPDLLAWRDELYRNHRWPHVTL